MAVVGEAHIVVRAITTSVKDDIRRGFDGVEDTVKRTGKNIAKSFQSDFARESDAAREKWAALTKTSFGLQTAVGSLAAGVSSLAGGLGALAGAAGGAAGSLVALGSAAVALKVGFGVAKFAMGGIMQAVQAATKANGGYSKSLKEIAFDAEEAALSVDRAAINLENAREAVLRTQDLPSGSRVRREAELAYREAELAYRRAQDAKKNGEKNGGGTDPYAGLTPSQKQFAKYLASLKPLMDDLKEAAASGFLPILEEQLKRIEKSPIPGILKDRFNDIGRAMGEAATELTNSILDPKNVRTLDTVLANIARLLPSFGRIAGSVYGSFLSILKEADPLTRRFVRFLEKKASAFENFIKTKEATGELEAFFNRSGDIAADFGKIFGNTFGLLGDVIKANFGPVSGGQYMLNWLKDATDGWKNLRENLGRKEFDGYFLSAAINSKAVLQSVGALVKELGKLGTMRSVKETFDKLKEGAPALGNILRAGADAGPVLASLVVQLTKIAEALADSGAIKTYFGVLEGVAKTVADLLQNEVIRKLLEIVGQIGAVGLAAGTLYKTFDFVFKAISGVILLPIKAIKDMPIAFAAAETGAKKFGVALRGAFGIIGLIAAGIMGVIELNERFNEARKATVNTTEEIRNEIVAGEGAAIAFQQALKDLGGGNLVFEKLKPSTLKGVADGIELVTINMDDLSENSNKVDLVLRALSDDMTGFGKSTQGTQDWFDKEADWLKIETAIANTGTALADIAASSIPDATAQFVNLAESYNLSDESAGYLLESMPDFKEQLKEMAIQTGLATDDQTLLNIAMQKGDEYATVLESGFAGVDSAAQHAADQVDALKDKILGFGEAQLDTRAAQRSFEEAVDAITESVKVNGTTLDINTEQGRNNQAALDNLARSAKDQAIAILDSTGSTEKMTESLEKGRDQLIKAGEDMGLTKDKAKELADTLLGTPEDIKITVDASTEKFDTKMTKLKTTYTPNWFEKTFPSLFGPGSFFGGGGKKDGGYVGRYANGGLVSNIKKFAPGGFVSGAGTARSDSIPAMLSNGEYVINARATAENRELLDRINNNQSVSMAPTVYMTINPSPGMDERELAEIVSRKIAFAMTKGGY